VFAPVAARLAAGTLSVSDVGTELQSLVQLDPAYETVGADSVAGVVVAVDHFGNLLTTLRTESVLALGSPGEITVEVAGHRLPVRGTYAEGEPGELLALPSSWGVLEVALRDGSAARALAVERGAPVVARAAPPGAPC
jgi:S-adenosylmethionine hydrolase